MASVWTNFKQIKIKHTYTKKEALFFPMEMAIKIDHQARSECRLAQALSYIGPWNQFRGLTRPRSSILKMAYMFPVGLEPAITLSVS